MRQVWGGHWSWGKLSGWQLLCNPIINFAHYVWKQYTELCILKSFSKHWPPINNKYFSVDIRCQLSSFRAPTLWFIDLTVATWHIQIQFSEFMPICFTRKRTKHKNTRSRPWYENGRRRLEGAQSINTERAIIECYRRYSVNTEIKTSTYE